MIKCPRCGADAQWGAPHCPRCLAPFVAPPTNAPPQVAPAQFAPGQFAPGPPLQDFSQPFPQPKSSRWIPGAVLGLLVLVGGLWFLFKPSGHKGGSAGSPSHAFALQREPDVPDAAPSGGLFKVTPQADQGPIVEISNLTPYRLRLTLQDVNGNQKTEWVPSFGSDELNIPEGNYQGSIDAPDDPMNVPAYGTVEIRNFHHYDASFVEVPSDGTDNSFHIGD